MLYTYQYITKFLVIKRPNGEVVTGNVYTPVEEDIGNLNLTCEDLQHPYYWDRSKTETYRLVTVNG